MGDLAADAELRLQDDATYTGMVSRSWEIWGPNGGHIASFALRAAELHSGRARPANATVHFLGVASFDAPITVRVRTQRAARQATSVAVEIEQDGRPILAAMIWAVDDGLPGLEHDELAMPAVPSWSELPTDLDRFAAEGRDVPPRHAFWDNFERRPPSWISDWEHRTPSPPLYQDWIRFSEGGIETEPWRQAARLLLLIDLGGWPSIGRRHVETGWMAPSIDVSCEFHRPDSGDEWFLLQGTSPFAGAGLIASQQHVWNDRGQLLASGVSHLLCRRIG